LTPKYGETTDLAFATMFLAFMLWKLFKSFSSSIARIVKEKTGIEIEREVQTAPDV